MAGGWWWRKQPKAAGAMVGGGGRWGRWEEQVRVVGERWRQQMMGAFRLVGLG